MLYWAFDPLYLYLVLPALLFAMWAQFKVKSSFKKYSQQRTSKGITGAAAARDILRTAGLHDVKIEKISGNLTDHFDPRANVIRLSDSVHDAANVAAVGVAAHEAGHAMQYAKGYFPIKLRSAILPITSVGSKLAVPLIILGFAFDFTGLINVAIVLFGAVTFFQLVTLPVEFNASRRAMSALGDTGLLNHDELPASRKVLTAAALTYVAALAVSLVYLIRFILLANRRR